jgi:hypothetical protein
MDIITKNPYRILGLSISASDRDITKRVSKLSVYAEMGKTKTYVYDFPGLASISAGICILPISCKSAATFNCLIRSSGRFIFLAIATAIFATRF